jgi:hypothetical protein
LGQFEGKDRAGVKIEYSKGERASFELNSEEEAKLLAAMAEADRGKLVSVSQVLQQIRRS